MLGRNSSKTRTALVSQEISAGPKSNAGPLLTIVGSSAKLGGKLVIGEQGDGASKGPRPAHLVEGGRAATTPR